MSLFICALGGLFVTAAATAVLDPYLWPSAIVGLPVGAFVAVAPMALSHAGLTLQAERQAGGVTERTRRRSWATLAAILGGGIGVGLGVIIAWRQALGVAAGLLAFGLSGSVIGALVGVALVYWRSLVR
ncbi:MAG: hypothetical protein ACLFR6_03215 [Salinarchaeum sp.]